MTGVQTCALPISVTTGAALRADDAVGLDLAPELAARLGLPTPPAPELQDVPPDTTAMGDPPASTPAGAPVERSGDRDSDPGLPRRTRVTAQDHDEEERPPPQVFCAGDVLTPEQAAAARPGDSVTVPAEIRGTLQSWQLPPSTRVVTVLEAWTVPVPAGARFRVVSVTTEPLAPDVYVVTIQEEP